jgi:outer membrane protein assembly factor BamE (lipoprotein component of BamABCDE complex)
MVCSCIPCNSNNQSHAFRKIPFDKEEWVKCEPLINGKTVRSQMIEDLMLNYHLSSMTKEKIIELLGKPIVPADKYTKEEWDIIYYLGTERSDFPLDDEYLVFRFDTEGRVTDYCVTTMK